MPETKVLYNILGIKVTEKRGFKKKSVSIVLAPTASKMIRFMAITN